MIRMTRIFWAGALAAALGMVVLGCGGAGEKPASVPKSEQDKAVGAMKDMQSGGKHGAEKAEKGEKPAEKSEKGAEKATKAEKKGAD